MKKIKFIKAESNSKFNQMIVPVNVFGAEEKLPIPLLYAAKKIKGSNITICYKKGLTQEMEDLIIKYYEGRFFERILHLMFIGKISNKTFLSFHLECEYSMYKYIGYNDNNAYFACRRSKNIDEILDAIIFKYPTKSVTKWCINLFKEKRKEAVKIEKSIRISKVEKVKKVKVKKIKPYKASVVKVVKDDINVKLSILKDILIGGECKEKDTIEKVILLYAEKKALISEKQKQIEALQCEIKALMGV